jgi:hypothetical protein
MKPFSRWMQRDLEKDNLNRFIPMVQAIPAVSKDGYYPNPGYYSYAAPEDRYI